MRQVSVQVLDRDSLAELQSGHRLQLVQGGKTIAEIVPVNEPSTALQADQSNRVEAAQRLKDMMGKGLHLEGLHIANRDDLYDRD